MTDTFDRIIDSEISESRRPKSAPPEGMVGTSASRREPRLQPHSSPGAVGVLFVLAIIVTALSVLAGVSVATQSGVIQALITLASGLWLAFTLYVAALVVDRVDAAAHWSRQTALLTFQGMAAKKD